MATENVPVKVEHDVIEKVDPLAECKKDKKPNECCAHLKDKKAKKPNECCAHLTKVNNFPEFFAGMASGLNPVEGICCAKECSVRAVGTCIDCPSGTTTFCQAHVEEHSKQCVGAHAAFASYDPLGGKHKVYCSLCDLWLPYSVVQKKCGFKRRNPFAEDYEHIRKSICHHAINVEHPVVPELVLPLPVSDNEHQLVEHLKNATPDERSMLLKNMNASTLARLMPFLPTEFVGRWNAIISDNEDRNFMIAANEDGHRYYEKINKVTWLSAFLKYRVQVQGRHYFSGILVKHKMTKDESCELYMVNKQPVEIRLEMSAPDKLILRSSHMRYTETVCHRKPMVEVKSSDLPQPQPYEYMAGGEQLAAEEVELVSNIEKLPPDDKEDHLASLPWSIQARIRPFCCPIVGTWEVTAPSMILMFEIVIKNGIAQFIQVFSNYTVIAALQYACMDGMHCFIGPVTIWKEDKVKQLTPHLDAQGSPVHIQLHLLSANALQYSYGSVFDEMSVRVAKRIPKLVPSCVGALRNAFIPADNMSHDYILSVVKCTVARSTDFANEVVHAVKESVDQTRLPRSTARQFRLGFFD